MLGLDTSMVVRLLVGLPEAQAQAARIRLERAVDTGEPVLVSDLVLAETYHALQCQVDRPDLVTRVNELVNSITR
jgi:predicted nucleic acid-binding protein